MTNSVDNNQVAPGCWLVIKFGGTSVSTEQCWQHIQSIIEQRLVEGLQVLVVCSAASGVSNQLEKLISAAAAGNDYEPNLQEIINTYQLLANDLKITCDLTDDFTSLRELIEGVALLNEASPRTKARIMAFGELLLTQLGAAYLKHNGIDIAWQDARELLIATTDNSLQSFDNYLNARCEAEFDECCVAKLAIAKVPVVITQGFIAHNEDNETVLLGRGGSDASAAFLAAKINAARCEIWTDVPGIYTANPRLIPEARLLKSLSYEEAQEIASMGGKVLHPNCITPLAIQSIPLWIKYTPEPERIGTLITHDSALSQQLIKSIQTKYDVMLVSITTLRMWRRVGFLADVFSCFKKHGLSIDLVSTSEASVTLSLDANINSQNPRVIKSLLQDLNQFTQAKLIEKCAAVSIIGRKIRTILHQLGDIFTVFEEQQIYLLSQAANDLNLTVVVDEAQAQRLTQQLHTLLIEQNATNAYYNQSWHNEFVKQETALIPWWQQQRDKLLALAQQDSPVFVYDEATVQQAINQLQQCQSVDQIFYAIKANAYPEILKLVYQAGLGFECVSLAEVQHVLDCFPKIERQRILFTPNFAPRQEYEAALTLGVILTIDNLHPLQHWPELFSKKEIFLRIDPGKGYGHHKHVITGGNASKFGIPIDDLSRVQQIIKSNDIIVRGLHSHSGSGILDAKRWQQVSLALANLLEQFPDVQVLDIGGGLGIVEKPGQQPLDLTVFDETLQSVKQTFPHFKLWIEPGRFIVAAAGVLLAKVTQIKQKGDIQFVGIETGMNSLIRPALYGSYHKIVNLTRFEQPRTQTVNVVGPICESGDTLGFSRLLPETEEGDILLIANTGAYGHCMSSQYNRRQPAAEHYLT